jgi:nucleoid-associated protein YgaU
MFKKEDAAPANDHYAAANPYAAGTGTAPQTPGYPPANPYGTPPAAGGYDTTGAGYTAPNYNQPYVQPPGPATGPGYADSYTPPATGGGGGAGRTHKVVKGDTLSGISKRYGVPAASIMKANNLTNPNNIVLGKTLIIP